MGRMAAEKTSSAKFNLLLAKEDQCRGEPVLAAEI
jgi:hypothetical protein